jgi:methylated-DNA-protein-cysteine methyltransferase related protein
MAKLPAPKNGQRTIASSLTKPSLVDPKTPMTGVNARRLTAGDYAMPLPKAEKAGVSGIGFTQARQKILMWVRRIPSGRVASYKTIADLAGLAGRARLVGKALHDSGGAPWWRVLRSDGSIAIPGQLERLAKEGVIGKTRIDLRRFGWPRAEELLTLEPDEACRTDR